ncbi:MAG: tRNA 4-thiouridine(8) synthase ThiI [Erysipelotrichaceae bacterium]|nr:tRNA 4-thiouridine(8) synthase ThiI [Erysipelotrichaceae bacterium]
MEKLQYEYLLIRFGELNTKGKNKNDFIKQLAVNIKLALNSHKNLRYERTRDHIYVILNGEDPYEIIPILQKVFGIRSIQPCLKVENDIDKIVEAVTRLMAERKGTFKISTRRVNKKFPHHSDEVNRLTSSSVLRNFDHNLKVDVHDPDYKVIVEIREEATYVMAENFLGAGGYPVSVGGKAILMLSGGIDSPVAGYLTMKRGVEIECIHYASMPYTSQAALDKVKKLTELLAPYQGRIRLHVVPFTDTQLAIYRHCNKSYAITIMRRMMYRLADRLCERRGALAIVNGESVGQVASQTLESMSVINDVTNRPVLRPVVTYDKLEIIDIANRIGTYETSILPYEDCCTIFSPENPIIKPKLEKVLKEESFMGDFEPLLQAALDNIETFIIYPHQEKEDEIDIM